MARFDPNRRRALRALGLAGISVALPPLEALAQARARRLIVFHWPQGVPTGWAPSASGPWFPGQAGVGWETTRCLMPLAPHRADFNILTGITYRQIAQAGNDGPHGHAKCLFTGHRGALGPSPQWVAARKLGTGTRFSLVATGIYAQGEGWWNYSAAGVREPLELSPSALFTRLFSNVNVDPTAAARAAQRKRSVLDYVKSDAADLQARLGRDDRARLDHHLTAIRELEKAVSGFSPSSAGSCVRPAAPPPDDYRLPEKQGNLSHDYSKMVEYTRLMTRLQVMAQRCDLTRVSFMSLGGTQNYSIFPHLGVHTDYHNVCHSGFNDVSSVGPRLDDRKLAHEYYQRIATYHMEQVAYLLGLLKQDDGLGSLLDDAAVICLSEFGDGGLHYDSYVPIIVAGKAGRGAAGMKTGQNLVYPCSFGAAFRNASFCASASGTPNRCTNDVWQSALEALGVLAPGQKFGDPTLDTRPLEGLWV